MIAMGESLTFIDIAVLLVVLLSMWRGFGAGFIKSFASLVTWLLVLIVASRTAKMVAPMLADFIENPVLQIAAAFLVVALAVMMGMNIVIAMLQGMLKTLKLGFLDRLFGGMLGAITGILKILVLLSVASPLLTYLPDWQSSLLVQNLLPFAPIATQLLQELLGEAWQQIQNPYQPS